MKSQQPEKSFQFKSSVRIGWLCLALAGLALMAGGLVLGRPAPGSVAVTIGVVMAIWTRRASIVRLFDDHFEMKVAPLAATRRVRYSDIGSVEVSKKVGLVTLRGEQEARPVKVPLKLLEDGEGQWLMGFLSRKAAA